MIEDRAGDSLVAALWDVVEDWSSAAIQRTREAAATGPTEVLDAETRMLISHAAQLRGAIEVHLEAAEREPASERAREAAAGSTRASSPDVAPGADEPGEVLARLHEAAHAQVCPECFIMVRLDEVATHDLVCVRHKTIEKMDRKLEEEQPDTTPDAEPDTTLDAEPDAEPDPAREPVAEPVSIREPEPAPAAPAHTCNSADFERPLCDACGCLHWYCSICGAQRDACREEPAAG